MIWEYLHLTRVYTKPKGKLPDYEEPVVLAKPNPTVEDFATASTAPWPSNSSMPWSGARPRGTGRSGWGGTTCSRTKTLCRSSNASDPPLSLFLVFVGV